MSDNPQTTPDRPTLAKATRLLSRQVWGLIRSDHANQRIEVRLCDIAPPKNFMGWPVRWERAAMADEQSRTTTAVSIFAPNMEGQKIDMTYWHRGSCGWSQPSAGPPGPFA